MDLIINAFLITVGVGLGLGLLALLWAAFQVGLFVVLCRLEGKPRAPLSPPWRRH